VANFEIVGLESFDSDNGSLVALESLKNIPFEIKRLYYIFDVGAGKTRGAHAFKTIEQYAICLNGHCDFHLDDGKNKADFHLDDPKKALHIKANVWRECSGFSKDCVLLIVASRYYSEEEYVKNYEEFLRNSKKEA
jgi:hypothetical protein